MSDATNAQAPTDETPTDEAPRVQRLWVSLNGRVLCGAHGGMYLSAAIERFPRRRRHHTPVDSWEAIKADERDRYHPEEFEALACEERRCGARL